MSEQVKLKPCPFCGGEAIIDCTIEPHDHVFLDVFDCSTFHTFICCKKCSVGLSGDEKKTKKEAEESAVELWNTRIKESGGV